MFYVNLNISEYQFILHFIYISMVLGNYILGRYVFCFISNIIASLEKSGKQFNN